MVKTFSLFIFLFLASTLIYVGIAQQTPLSKSPLTLAKSFSTVQEASTYAFYSSTFNITKKFLAVTINPTQKSTLSEFLSLNDSSSNQTYTQYPNNTNNMQRCNHYGLNTCILSLADQSGSLPNREVTLYLSILASQKTEYSLFLELIDEIYLNLTQQYKLDFAKSQAKLLKIDATHLNYSTNSSIVFTYEVIKGQFDAVASFNELPYSKASNGVVLKPKTFGTYSKVIDIPQIANTSSIYVLVSSEKGSVINFTLIQGVPQLRMNSTLSEISSKQSNYTIFISDSTQNATLLNALYIDLIPFTGYGSFQINYCLGLNLSVQVLDGKTCRFILSLSLRFVCQQFVRRYNYDEFSTISTVNPISFGYQIALQEQYNIQSLIVNQQTISFAFSLQNQTSFPLQLHPDTNEYYVKYVQKSRKIGINSKNKTGVLLFILQQCQTKKKVKTCSQVQNASDLFGQFLVTTKQGYSYEVNVDNSELTQQDLIQYKLLLGYNQTNNTDLIENKAYLQEIALRQYKFYIINISNIKKRNKQTFKAAQVNITAQNLNGNIDFLSSLAVPQPTMEDYIKNASQIKFQLNNTITYTIDNSVQLIYLSVYGQTASLFQLSYTFSQIFDLPISYSSIEDDIVNKFTLNSSYPYELITFEAHIKPYSVSVDGYPKCIRYGYSLPLSETCYKRLPPLLYQKTLYMNISNGKPSSSNFTFNVTVSSGSYNLTADNSVLMSCNEACFSLINVTMEVDSRVIIKGKGQINSVYASSQTNVKDTLTLNCPTYPCQTVINASLPYGGSMNLFLIQSQIAYLNGSTFAFSMNQLPKNVLFPIKSIVDYNDIILRCDGMSLALIYDLVVLDNNNHNIVNLNFTQMVKTADAYYESIPFRQTFSFTVSNDESNATDCSLSNIYCLVMVTFLVDVSQPFNLRFLNSGQGFVSSYSGPAIKMPINSPIFFNSSLQMIHFEINNHSNNNLYRLQVQPLSDCEPVVLSNTQYIEHEYVYGPGMINATEYPYNISILIQEPCLFYATLTNSYFQPIISNKYYALTTDKGEITVVLTLVDPQITDFTLRVQTDAAKIDYILVNQLNNSYDQIVIPNVTNHSYISTNSNQLQIKSPKFHRTYIVKVITKSESVRIIAEQLQNIITTSSNQIVRRTILPGSYAKFVFPSKSSLTVNVQNFKGKFNMSTTISKQVIIADTTISGSQSFQINPDSNSTDIVQYTVIFQNNGSVAQTISLSFHQDNKYLRQLYERIMHYDAFTDPSDQNCYNYKAPLQVGRNKIVLDFVLDASKYPNCSCIDLQYNISINGMADDRALKVLNTNFTKVDSQRTAYRLQTKFFSNQTYTFCFSTPNKSAIYKEYYVLIQNPMEKHLVPTQSVVSYVPLQMDNYILIEQFTIQNLMIELTMCDSQDKNDKTIFGSSSQLPKTYSQLENNRNEDSIFAKVSAEIGYYFFGVVNQKPMQGPYSLKYHSIGNDTYLLSSVWKLEDKNILNATFDHSGQITFGLPKLTSLSKAEQTNITLAYIIYIQNTTGANSSDFAGGSLLDIQARCPNYKSSSHKASSAKQQMHQRLQIINKTINFSYSELKDFLNTHDNIEIKFKHGDIPAKFNITGRVDVNVNNQSFSYFYNTKQMELPPSSNSDSSQGQYVVVFVIILLIIFVGGVIYAYIRYRGSQSRSKVDFQLANFGQNSAVVQKNQGLIIAPKTASKTESKKGYYEMNEQIKL